MNMNTSTSVVSISGEKLSTAVRVFHGSQANFTPASSSSRERLEEVVAPVVSTDVLVQLRSNLAQLEELHARLRFVMSEVSYLLKRD
jgi:hypothetical protein